jgi:ASC-1-like (ASCH) protein
MLQISINYNSLKLIEKGYKLYEIRIKRGIFNNISKGDSIKLYNNDESIIKNIGFIHEFKNLDELFSNLYYKLCVPQSISILDAKLHISKFYSNKVISCNKIIAIKLI